MAWPTNPVDGQQVTVSNVLYQYNSSLGVWNKVQLTAPTFLANGTTVTVSNNFTAPGNISGSYILGNGSQLSGITATVTTLNSGNVTYLAPFTSSVQRTGLSKYSDIVSVKDFGATGNGSTDDTAAIQAAFDSGKHVYIPTGQYRITNAIGFYTPGQMITGDGRTQSVFRVGSDFNLSATGVFVFNTGEPGPQLENLGIVFTQPTTSNRAALTSYPPAIYAQSTPRFSLYNCRIVNGTTGIDMRGNSGGATIDGLEMSCYNYGVRIDGSLDTVRILRLQYWPFDIAGTANESIFFDSTNRGVVSGRCDDLKINSCLFINGGIQVELQSTVSGTTFGAITDTDFDSYGYVTMAGGNMSISNCYFTLGNAAYRCILHTGGYLRVESSEFEAAVVVTNPFIAVTGSTCYYQMVNCLFRNSGVGGGYYNMTNGTAIISSCQFIVGANQVWTNPLVGVASSGRMTFIGNRASNKGTGSGNLITVTTDNWHSICNNLGVGWGYSYPAGYTQMVVANNK